MSATGTTASHDAPTTQGPDGDGARNRGRRLGDVASHPLFWPGVALVLLLAVNVVRTPTFLRIRLQDGHLYGSLIDILRNGAPTLLIAVGMTLVIATRGIDLSVGAVVAIAGAVACQVIVKSDSPGSAGTALSALALALAVALVLGVWNGFLVVGLGIQPIIATLVLMTAGRGVAMLLTGGQIITVRNETFEWLGGGFLVLPVAVVVAALVVAGVALVTRRTALGMLIESVGVNPEASRLAGVRSAGIVWGVYAFAGLAAGLAGLIISSDVHAADANNAGLWIEMDAILAVVIGGTSLAGGRYRLAGTVLGAMIIQTLTTTVYTAGVPTNLTLLFKAVVVILVCLLQAPRARALVASRRRPPSTGQAVPAAGQAVAR